MAPSLEVELKEHCPRSSPHLSPSGQERDPEEDMQAAAPMASLILKHCASTPLQVWTLCVLGRDAVGAVQGSFPLLLASLRPVRGGVGWGHIGQLTLSAAQYSMQLLQKMCLQGITHSVPRLVSCLNVV